MSPAAELPVPPAPPAAPRPVPPIVVAVYGATGIVRFGFGLTVSVFAAYIAGHSSGLTTADVGTVGLVSGLSPIGEFSTVVGSGLLADRRGRFPVLLGGLAAAAALLLAVSFTRDPWVLGSLNLGFGIASGAILAASLAVVGDHAASTERGVAMGRFDAVNLAGWIGGFAAGFGLLGILPNAELPWVFRAGALALFLGFAYAALRFRHGEDPTAGPGGVDLRRLLAVVVRRDVLLVTVPWFVIYLLLGTVFVFLGSAASGVGVAPTTLAAAIGGGGLLLLLTQPGYGRLADRYGRTRLMLVGAAGFVAVLAGAGVLATYGENAEGIALVGAGALAALAYGPAALASLTDLSRTLSRATTMAVYTLTIALGMWVGLSLSSALYDRFQAPGLDAFFAGIAVVLTVLTAARYWDVRTGRAVEGT